MFSRAELEQIAERTIAQASEVEELKGRLQELRRQRSRVRDSLEEAMCRGDRFKADELRSLLEHPILAPALSRLVAAREGSRSRRRPRTQP